MPLREKFLINLATHFAKIMGSGKFNRKSPIEDPLHHEFLCALSMPSQRIFDNVFLYALSKKSDFLSTIILNAPSANNAAIHASGIAFSFANSASDEVFSKAIQGLNFEIFNTIFANLESMPREKEMVTHFLIDSAIKRGDIHSLIRILTSVNGIFISESDVSTALAYYINAHNNGIPQNELNKRLAILGIVFNELTGYITYSKALDRIIKADIFKGVISLALVIKTKMPWDKLEYVIANISSNSSLSEMELIRMITSFGVIDASITSTYTPYHKHIFQSYFKDNENPNEALNKVLSDAGIQACIFNLKEDYIETPMPKLYNSDFWVTHFIKPAVDIIKPVALISLLVMTARHFTIMPSIYYIVGASASAIIYACIDIANMQIKPHVFCALDQLYDDVASWAGIASRSREDMDLSIM